MNSDIYFITIVLYYDQRNPNHILYFNIYYYLINKKNEYYIKKNSFFS